MFLRLLLTLVLITFGAAALVVIGFVALNGQAGGAPFTAATAPASTLVSGQTLGTEANARIEPAPPARPTETSTTPITTPAQPAVETPTSNQTTSPAPPAPGLHDLPPFNQPAGYEIRDRWSDGPSRLTLWQRAEEAVADLDIFDTIEFGSGAWRTSRSGESDGVTWATLTAVGHPWCIWLEIYAIRSDAGTNNLEDPAPEFLVVESPFCDSEPGSFA